MENNQIKHPFLKGIYQELLELRANVKNSFSSLSEEQLNWKVDEKSWSIAECMKHLMITGKAYRKKYEEMMEKKNTKKQEENEIYRPTFFGKVMLSFVNPESKRKISTPKAFNPKFKTSNLSKEVLEKYQNSLEILGEEIKTAHIKKQSLNKVKIKTPISSLISFSLGDYFEIHLRHNQRHITQAQRVMQNKDFPKN